MSDHPYSPPAAELYKTTEVIYAGFWRRVGASLVDTVVTLLAMLPLMIVFDIGYLDSMVNSTGTGSPLDIFLYFILPLVLAIFFWVKFRATPGKMLFGCIVVNAKTGENLSIGRSILRYIGYHVSVISFCIGFFWVGIDARKQGWHDKIAGTVVLRKDSALPKQ